MGGGTVGQVHELPGGDQLVPWTSTVQSGSGWCDGVGQPETEGSFSRLGMVGEFFLGQVQCLWLERRLSLPCLPLGPSLLHRFMGGGKNPSGFRGQWDSGSIPGSAT